MKKQALSIIASSIIITSYSYAGGAGCSNQLVDGGTTSITSLPNDSCIASDDTHTLIGSGSFNGDLVGVTTGAGNIILDGDLDLGNGSLGYSNSNYLKTLTVNSGKTLTVANGHVGINTITLGGTLHINNINNLNSGNYVVTNFTFSNLNGLSEGQGNFELTGVTFTPNGIIGLGKKLNKISLNSSTLTADLNIGVTAITSSELELNNSSTLNISGASNDPTSTVINADITSLSGTNNINIIQNGKIIGKVGTSTNRLSTLSITSGKTLTLGGDVLSNPIYTDNLNFNSTGILAIDSSGFTTAIGDGDSVTIVDSTNPISYGTTSITDSTMIDYSILENDNSVVVSASYNSASSLGLDDESAKIYNNAKSVIGSSDSFFIALNNATTSDERENILNSLNTDGSFSAIVGGVSLANSTGGTIGEHLALIRTQGNDTGIATGDQFEGLNVWAQIYGNDIDQDDRAGKSGYDAKTYGLVIGADKEVDTGLTFGLAATLGNSNIDTKSTYKTSTDIKSYQLSAYLSKELSEDYFVEGILSYSKNNNETIRNIAGGSQAKADFDTDIIQAKLSTGKTIEINDYQIVPKTSLSYTYVNTENYNESGAGVANLSVDTKSMNKYEIYAGTTVARTIKLENSSELTPEFRLGVTYAFGNDKVETNSTLQSGGSLNSTGLDAADTSLDAGLGLSYSSSDKLTEVRFDYDLTSKSDYIKHSGMLTFKYKF